MTDDHKFQVNLRGVIDLLSHHLYSGPQVYIRELLQNAVDAIAARRHLQPGHAGEIKLEVFPGGEGQRQPTLVVYDNGIGLTEPEVHDFLATIGRSSKRESLNREDFIGQFGIGLLSAFVVCDEIVVITRSVQDGAPSIKWTGRTDGTYDIARLDADYAPGTQVFLRSKPGCQEFFEPDYVRRTARHFGSFLRHAIEVVAGDESWTINEPPPWDLEFDSPEEQRAGLLRYGRELLGQDFLDAVPLASEVGQVRGVAYILPQAGSASSKRTHRVYLKNMLLSEQTENLLPDWAFFVKCVVNANDLRPTAARESFYEDETLQECRAHLGASLRDYLVELSRNEPERLDRLIGLHYMAIKALAVEDDEFYRIFIDFLPFDTSLGQMTLQEYLQQHDVVRYVHTNDEFRQIAPVASAESLCIINAGFSYDRDLLEKLPEVFRNRRIERFDLSDFSQSFQDLSPRERAPILDFLKLAGEILQPFRCEVDVRRFAPPQLPTLYVTNDAATFLRSVEQSQEVSDELWSGLLEQIAEDPRANAFAQLCLNYNNPLIRRISVLKNREAIRRSLEMLYVQALLLGHHPLKSQEMNLLNEGLLGLIEMGLNAQSPETPPEKDHE